MLGSEPSSSGSLYFSNHGLSVANTPGTYGAAMICTARYSAHGAARAGARSSHDDVMSQCVHEQAGGGCARTFNHCSGCILVGCQRLEQARPRVHGTASQAVNILELIIIVRILHHTALQQEGGARCARQRSMRLLGGTCSKQCAGYGCDAHVHAHIPAQAWRRRWP